MNVAVHFGSYWQPPGRAFAGGSSSTGLASITPDHGRAGARDLATVVDVVRPTREQELDVVNRTFHREV